MSWAGVLGGQLAEATERSDKPSAWAEFLGTFHSKMIELYANQIIEELKEELL